MLKNIKTQEKIKKFYDFYVVQHKIKVKNENTLLKVNAIASLDFLTYLCGINLRNKITNKLNFIGDINYGKRKNFSNSY